MNTDWIQGTIDVSDEIELFYTRTGQGNKPPIVLAHGFTDSGLCWHQFASDLEEQYDVIMYDAYGHGKSSRVNLDLPIDHVKDLHGLITALDLKKPVIMGHSMGAATAASFASAFPEMLSALVLEDPPLMEDEISDEQMKATFHEWNQQNLAAKQKTQKELIKLKKKESPNWQEVILPEWAQAKLDLDPAIFEKSPMMRTDWRELVKTIKVPTLIIAGDNELGAIVTPKLGLEAMQLLEHGEFGHISAAGHCVRYEQYRPYLSMVRLFLKRNYPA